MLSISKKLFDEWNLNRINYCHWKSNEHLIEGLNGETDVDVLVCPDDKQKCESLLQYVGFKKFIPQKNSRYLNVDEWLGFDYTTGRLVHVHLHFNILTGIKYVKEYILPWTSLALSTKIKEEETGVYIVSPNLEIIILFTRIVLKARKAHNIKIDRNYYKEIKYLKRRVDYKKVKILCLKLFPTNGEFIFDVIYKGKTSKSNMFLLRKILKKELRNNSTESNIMAFLKHNYLKYISKFKIKMNLRLNSLYVVKKIPANTGLSFCFIGSDGAGKSTIITDINKWLLWKIESRKFYLGSGEQYKSIFKTLRRIIQKLRGKSKDTNKKQINNDYKLNNTKENNRKSFLKYCTDIVKSYELIRIAKYKKKVLKKAYKYMNRGGIALFDRFPQTQFEGIYDGPKIASRYDYNTKIFNFLVKKEREVINKALSYSPTIVFKLQLSPEESIKRKPDHNLQEIKKKAEITKSLEFDSSTVYTINAEQPYIKEILEVKRKIWEEINVQSL